MILPASFGLLKELNRYNLKCLELPDKLSSLNKFQLLLVITTQYYGNDFKTCKPRKIKKVGGDYWHVEYFNKFLKVGNSWNSSHQ